MFVYTSDEIRHKCVSNPLQVDHPTGNDDDDDENDIIFGCGEKKAVRAGPVNSLGCISFSDGQSGQHIVACGRSFLSIQFFVYQSSPSLQYLFSCVESVTVRIETHCKVPDSTFMCKGKAKT